MTRLELANQLIEGQPAFHFAFIPENGGREVGQTFLSVILNQMADTGAVCCPDPWVEEYRTGSGSD